jgi:AcrR family transcriptional regulator
MDFVKDGGQNDPMEKQKRRYSGQSFADRQSERRARLVRAALAIAGRFGLEGTSVAAICAEAGLTPRYFYESFPNREAIFLEAYRLAQEELLSHIDGAKDRADPVRGALTGFYTALYTHPGLARVFLVDLDDHGDDMKAASQEGAKKLTEAFALKARHPLLIAGIIGAVVDVAKRWIESEFAEPVENVVEIALPFTRVGQAATK